jgi:hypothetical protein
MFSAVTEEESGIFKMPLGLDSTVELMAACVLARPARPVGRFS